MQENYDTVDWCLSRPEGSDFARVLMSSPNARRVGFQYVFYLAAGTK